MFAVVQKHLAGLKDRWSTTGPAVQLIIAAIIILISALIALWLIDKLFIYLLARSYVDDVAVVFDLNKHLAKAIALAVFVAAVYFIGKMFSRSQASRRVGYLGIVGLLIAHSLFLWQGTKDQKFTRKGEAIKCYVLTHDGDVRFGEHPGIDPATGRLCRPVTPELVDKLDQYSKGRRPQRITSDEPVFFNTRSGEPSVWYFRDKDGTIEIYDLMGFHPETGEELQPVTRDIADLWKAQNERREARPPKQVDPETFPFFDAITGKPRVWYWRGANGEYEFYDNPGFHPRTGEPLAVITREAIAAWNHEKEAQEQRGKNEDFRRKKEEQDNADREERERERLQEKQREAEAEKERERQSGSLCDQMAANPTDSHKPADAPSVPYDQLKTQAKAASEACALAMKANTDEIRYRYEYARALEIDEPQKAFMLHKQLIQDGYLASYDNAGSILVDTYKNIPEAIKYFKEGARRGDADSMVNLAFWVDKHYVYENDPIAARYALLTRAAQLGHAGAQRFLEQERIKFQQLQQQREFQQQQQQLMLQMFGTIMQGIAHH